MSDNFLLFDIGSWAASEVALFIGATMLIIFLLPSIFRSVFFGNQIRWTIIERHRNNLKAASVRRDHISQKWREIGRGTSILSLFDAIVPSRIANDKRKLLRSAGFAHEWSLAIFMIVKMGSLSVFFVSLYIFLFLSPGGSNEQFLFVLFSVSLFIFFVSDRFVHWNRKKRLKRLDRGLPDCLDLLVICAEAGLSLDAGLKRVAEEFIDSVPELAEELLLASVELSFLPNRRQALVNLALRADTPAFRGVTTALIQTEKYGTPLAQALRTLSNEFRETRLLDAEEKAARLPAILTVPMICFILPALFIVLAGPAFIKVFETIH